MVARNHVSSALTWAEYFVGLVLVYCCGELFHMGLFLLFLSQL